MSAAVKQHITACDGSCGGAVCAPVRSPTSIENILVSLLAKFPTVKRECRFGSYAVDAYLPPPYHLAFEADGAYWHSSQKQRLHDAKRDAYLLVEHNLPVVRLSEAELLYLGERDARA